uniref:Transient receptor potential cation channel subfamily M member 2-like n=1 Tax=Crassostrea virginica TaxID=6565 RepID=A0A8B8DX49_CRAVI|nr:transient receptor potential cation channel subfamily M member 2-like [Crassostrea virginica]
MNGDIPNNCSNAEKKPKPKLVLSVIGDSKSFVPRAWPKSVFKRALIEAGKSSGGDTLILYRNKDVGVSTVVLEAYEDYRTMQPPNEELSMEIKNNDMDPLSLEKSYMTQKAQVNVYNEDLPFEMPIPVVIILLEGDVDSIEQVMEATRKGIPVIIIKGSGKAADIILNNLDSDPDEQNQNLRREAALLFGLKFQQDSFMKMKENIKLISEKSWLVTKFDSENDDPQLFPKLVGEAVVRGWALENIGDKGEPENRDDKRAPENNDDKNIDNMQSRGTLNNPSEIPNEFEYNIDDQPIASWKVFNSENDDVEKISSILKSTSSTIHSDSNFTSPSCLPLDFFYVYQVLQENELMEKCGHSLLLEAMKSNRCDYVKVLMDRGVNIKLKDLPELYQSTLLCPYHKKKKKIDIDSVVEKCDHLGMMWMMKRINKSKTKKCFTKTKGNKVSKAAKAICRELLDYQGNKEEKTKKDENDDASLDDLLLWALYANRPRIAEMVWLRDEHQLTTGLLCYEILRKLSEMADDVKEQNLSSELLQHAQLFYKKTQNLLDAMYEKEPAKTIKLIDDVVIMWGIKINPLTFAYESFMYEFIAKPACQKYLNGIWYNRQAPDFVPWFKSLCTDPIDVLRSPLMKYICNYLLFMSMLICYSGFVTTSVKTKYYERHIARVLEYYVYFWGFGDLLEEFFSCFGFFHGGVEGKSIRSNWALIKRHLNNFWNLVDMLSYALLVTALFVRHFHPSEEFTIARRMFSLSLLIMYLRFLEAFLMSRRLGPTLIMIKEMLKDLLGFISLMIVVILGVGFYYHANLWPDHAEFWKGNWAQWRIWKVIYYPYWQIYGESFNEYLAGEDTKDCTFNMTEWSSDPSIERCPEEDWTVLAVSAFYMLFSNLLLVNLVIAMFSSTYERVTANAENLWRFERYSVIVNYKCRVPSPVNLLWNFRRFYVACKKSKCRKKNKTDSEKDSNRKNEEFRRKFQRIIAYEVSDKFNNIS